ncbi:hypothetical protein EK904_003563 [Melospiza melodia maxima]|nr:hypothetical protein EK904_003563 [Melospiza melodia maxima]
MLGQVEDVRSSLTSEDGQGAIGQGHHAVRWLAAAQVLLVVPLCKTQPGSIRTALAFPSAPPVGQGLIPHWGRALGKVGSGAVAPAVPSDQRLLFLLAISLKKKKKKKGHLCFFQLNIYM